MAYVEVLVKGDRRAYINLSEIRAVFTAPGLSRDELATPEHQLTFLLTSSVEIECFGTSVAIVMEAIKMYRKTDEWLRLP